MRMWFFFLWGVISFFPLHAGISTHLKQIVHDGGKHKIAGIDCIYMINLDERPEKLQKSYSQLKPYGIVPLRVSAVNGWKLPLKVMNDVGVRFRPGMQRFLATSFHRRKGASRYGELGYHHEVMHVEGKTYFGHCSSPGMIGINLSHLSVLKDAYERGYQKVWIMEDDIEVIQNPLILPRLVGELDRLIGRGKWDLLFTDRDTKNAEGNYIPCRAYALRPNFTPSSFEKFGEEYQVNETFREVGARYGAYSYIITRRGMKKLLDFFKKYHIFLPYDLEYTMPHGIRLFTVLDDVVSTRVDALSDNGYETRKK